MAILANNRSPYTFRLSLYATHTHSGLLLAEKDIILGSAAMRLCGLVSLVNFVGCMEVADQCIHSDTVAARQAGSGMSIEGTASKVIGEHVTRLDMKANISLCMHLAFRISLKDNESHIRIHHMLAYRP